MSGRLLYVDVTTSWQEAGRHAHGTTRVDRGIVEAMARLGRPDIRFFRFDRWSGRFEPVTPEAALAVATARVQRTREAPVAARPGRLKRIGLRLEQWVKTSLRQPLRRRLALRAASRAAPRAQAPGAPAPAFEPGSVLFFPSEMHRHDFAALMALRHSLDLDFAFVFFDLLDHLPAGDPRLSDPDAVDIPGTDFLLRQGALLFSISRFSTAALRAMLATRAADAPPVAQIRLAGDLDRALLPRPVQGLAPGRFVLAVGDIGVRKNQTLLFEVWRRLAGDGPAPLPLVCVGRVEPELVAPIAALQDHPVLRDAIRIETNIDDEALAWLYANCRFTVFASLAEGFGLPVAEGLSHGKPCVASNAQAIPEAGQGAAIGLDPRDADAWTAAVAELMWNDDALAAAERSVAETFTPVTWPDTVADILSGFGRLGIAAG